MSFDEIFDLTAGVFFYFYNITECKTFTQPDVRLYGLFLFFNSYVTSSEVVRVSSNSIKKISGIALIGQTETSSRR